MRFADGFEATVQKAWAQASSATKPEIQKTVARFRAATPREQLGVDVWQGT